MFDHSGRMLRKDNYAASVNTSTPLSHCISSGQSRLCFNILPLLCGTIRYKWLGRRPACDIIKLTQPATWPGNDSGGLIKVLNMTDLVFCKQGRPIIREGDADSQMFVMLAGAADVIKGGGRSSPNCPAARSSGR